MNQIARRRLWANARLLVFDVETTRSPDRGPLRIVSIAAVTVRNAHRTARWAVEYVNPGCPIDEKSAKIHNITDALVADAPTFAAIARSLATLLRPDPDERTIFVAHNVSFDAPVIREELARVRETMPELPVLDTMALMSVAGVVTADGRRRLKNLCAALGIALPADHQAAADAEATAEALIEMLNRAADEGHDDLDALLTLLGGHTTESLRFVARFRDAERPLEPVLSPVHLATHATILPAKPGKRVLAAWLDAADECARLRCGGLDDRVAAAEMPPADLLAHMLPRLRKLAAVGMPAEVATYLGAVMPLLRHLSPSRVGDSRLASRIAAAALDGDLGPLLDALRRCVAPISCPACRRGDPCSLDVWRLVLAERVVEGGTKRSGQLRSFVTLPSGEGVGTPYPMLAATGHARLADFAVRLVHRQWCDVGQREQAATLVRRIVDAGCSDPEIIEAYAAEIARRGTPEVLAEAMAVCEAALILRDGSTDDAWDALAARLTQLASRASRFRVRYEDERDADGNLVAKRRHHPTVPLCRLARFHPNAA